MAAGRRLAERARCTAFGRFAYGYLIEHQSGDLAANIAFHALLYLFPLCGAITTIVGYLLRNEEALMRVTSALARVLPSDEWRRQMEALLATKNNAGLIGVVSTIGLFWLGASFLESLARAFNRLYEVRSRAALAQRLLALGMIVLVAALLLLTVAASILATLIVDHLEPLLVALGVRPLGLGVTAGGLALGTGLGTAFVLFLTLYWAIPNVRQRFRDVWPGAALAALLLVAATQLFPLYVRFAPANSYGKVLSLLVLLTTWLYLLAHIILVGAAINAFRYGRAGAEAASVACDE